MLLKFESSILRAIEEKDCELLRNMLNDETIDCMTIDTHLPVSELQEKEWVKNYRNSDKCIRLMVELNNGKTIGMVILSNIDYKTGTASLGFKRLAKKEDRLPNDMFNACVAMLRFAFNELGLNCINCRTLTYNDRSLRLQERLGFKKEGVLRSRIFKNGSFQDLISSSLLRCEFLY